MMVTPSLFLFVLFSAFQSAGPGPIGLRPFPDVAPAMVPVRDDGSDLLRGDATDRIEETDDEEEALPSLTCPAIENGAPNTELSTFHQVPLLPAVSSRLQPLRGPPSF